MMQVIFGAHQLVLAFLMATCSTPAVAEITATTTPVPGSCTPPNLGEHADVSACQGLIPPASCVVQCAVGYKFTQGNSNQASDPPWATHYCYTVEDGFIGVGPECANTQAPTPAPTPAPGISLELGMEVSNTSEFTMDNEPLKDALAQGIAKALDGVEPSQVDIVSIEVESDDGTTARRLSSGRVVVTSEINFPEGAPSVSAADIQGVSEGGSATAIITKIQEKINEELAATTSLTVSGLTATAEAKGTAPTPAPTQSPSPTPASPDDETGFASSLGCSVSVLALVAGVAAFQP